ncbi:MAG: DUF1552 domain-containing protein [Bradymonadia bacterium]
MSKYGMSNARMSATRRISRRNFIRGAAGGLMALPLLSELGGGVARAQAQEAFPKRFIVFFQPNGTLKELWSPQGQGADMVLPELLAPLTPFKDQLNIFDGVDNTVGHMGPGGPHHRSISSVLTGAIIQEGDFVSNDGRRAGWSGGASLDQIMVDALNPPTQFGSLELGVNVRENVPMGRMIYRGAGQPLAPENDPRAAYDRLFSMVSQAPGELDKLALQRRSVLDVLKADFSRLNRKLATPDREKLGQHLDSVRALERRLGIVGSMNDACANLARPPEMDVTDEELIEAVMRLQIDILVTAMSCDLTRIGSIQSSSAFNKIRFKFLGLDDRDGHSLSHAGDNNMDLQEKWRRMLTWYSTQFAYLLERLASVPEGDGTMLDNTIVLWCSELSRGNTHNLNDLPFLLAGKGGGALQTGRHLVYDGVPHNDLLLAVLKAMDVEQATIGHAELCSGPLSGVL